MSKLLTRARGGVLLGDELDYLLYVTGGIALTGVETSITYYGATANDDKRVTGFAIGGGIETWLFGNDWITTRFEYLYVDVPHKSYDISYAGLPAQPVTPPLITSGPYRFKTGVHHLRSSWNIHF